MSPGMVKNLRPPWLGGTVGCSGNRTKHLWDVNRHDSGAAALARREAAERAHRLLLEVELLRETGVISTRGLARAQNERGAPPPHGRAVWTHTTVSRLRERSDRKPARPWQR
jgi:hypothetical protein